MVKITKQCDKKIEHKAKTKTHEYKYENKNNKLKCKDICGIYCIYTTDTKDIAYTYKYIGPVMKIPYKLINKLP